MRDQREAVQRRRHRVDPHTTLNKAQWVINGYALVLRVLIPARARVIECSSRLQACLESCTAGKK